MNEQLIYQSIAVPLAAAGQLHIMRFYCDKSKLGPPVFMLHGALSCGEGFYAGDGSGLACYLARQGYDVFVGDLRGRGKSQPPLCKNADFGSHELITEDIPALLACVAEQRGNAPQLWVGHGWGGVLLSAYYARFGERAARVEKMIQFGVRRQCPATRFRSQWLSGLIYSLAPLLIKAAGLFPLKRLGIGSSDQSAGCFNDYRQWSESADWLDLKDGFSYAQAAANRPWPASIYIASKTDTVLGHPQDVRRFISSLGEHDSRLLLLSRRDGNKRNYNHNELVSHRDGDSDYFPTLLQWLQESSPQSALGS